MSKKRNRNRMRLDVMEMNSADIERHSNRMMQLRMKPNMPQWKPNYKKTIEVLSRSVQANKELVSLIEDEILDMLSDEDYHYIVAIINNMDGFGNEQEA